MINESLKVLIFHEVFQCHSQAVVMRKNVKTVAIRIDLYLLSLLLLSEIGRSRCESLQMNVIDWHQLAVLEL